MKEEEKNIIEVIHELLVIMGNPILVKIFNEHRNNEKELYFILKDYLRGIYNDIHDDNDDEEVEKTRPVLRYAYINGIVIDMTNISRIELDSNYNPKNNKNKYFIRIIKKYPSPLEEEYIIPFNSEGERDKGYDILRAKLKLANIYII